MVLCKICCEDKPLVFFSPVPSFTKFKKHKVLWCHDCQKMFVTMKKEQKAAQRFVPTPDLFTVSFF